MEHDEIERKLCEIADGMQYRSEDELQTDAMREFHKRRKRKTAYKKWGIAIACVAMIAVLIPIGFLFKKDDPGYQNDIGNIVQDTTEYSNIHDFNARFSTQFLGLRADNDRSQQMTVYRYDVSNTVAWLEEVTLVDTSENYSSTNIYVVVTKSTIEKFEQMASLCSNQQVVDSVTVSFSHRFKEEEYLYESYAMWEYKGIKYYMYQFSLCETDFMDTVYELIFSQK